jgi:hypothetical protein
VVKTDNYNAAFNKTIGDFTAIGKAEITQKVQLNDVTEQAVISIE